MNFYYSSHSTSPPGCSQIPRLIRRGSKDSRNTNKSSGYFKLSFARCVVFLNFCQIPQEAWISQDRPGGVVVTNNPTFSVSEID